MDWGDSPEQAAFRQQVRNFVRERLPEHYRRKAEGAPDESWSGGWQTDRAGEGEAHDAAVEWASALSEQSWIAAKSPLRELLIALFRKIRDWAQAMLAGLTGAARAADYPDWPLVGAST